MRRGNKVLPDKVTLSMYLRELGGKLWLSGESDNLAKGRTAEIVLS